MHLGAMDKLIKSVENRKPYHVSVVLPPDSSFCVEYYDEKN